MKGLTGKTGREKKIVLDTNCHTAFLTGDAQGLIALAAAEIVFLFHAHETGAALVSYDSHFEKIIGLKIWQLCTA